MTLLVNIDVDDLDKAMAFYCDGLGLKVGRRFDGWIELVGESAPIYLLPKRAGTRAKAAGASVEREPEQHAYGRLALLADPFGNGFCLLQFTGRGYDEIVK